jgi:hypothetical protein
MAPLVNLIRLVVASSLVMPTPPGHWSASASYCAAASRPAPLVPRVRLVTITLRLSSDQRPSTNTSAFCHAMADCCLWTGAPHYDHKGDF